MPASDSNFIHPKKCFTRLLEFEGYLRTNLGLLVSRGYFKIAGLQCSIVLWWWAPVLHSVCAQGSMLIILRLEIWQYLAHANFNDLSISANFSDTQYKWSILDIFLNYNLDLCIKNIFVYLETWYIMCSCMHYYFMISSYILVSKILLYLLLFSSKVVSLYCNKFVTGEKLNFESVSLGKS